MKVSKWKFYCLNCNKIKYTWDVIEPIYCPCNETHTISDIEEISCIDDSELHYPKGNGVRFRTPCLTDMTSYEFMVAPGKKIEMIMSKVTFCSSIKNLNNIVFEIQMPLDGTNYYIVDQCYYYGLEDLVVDCDEVWGMCDGSYSFFRINFLWPKSDAINRKPTILPEYTKVKIYLTSDNKHSGIGVGGENEYYYLNETKIYNPYNESSSLPTWPDGWDKMKFAHICFHCVSFDKNVVIPGE